MSLPSAVPDVAREALPLAVDDVSFGIGGLQILSQVSLRVDPGSITTLIGPNGAGKSSLINCVTGVYRPQHGQIRFGESLLSGRRPDAIVRLGVVRTFQNIDLFKHLTVLTNILVGADIHMQGTMYRYLSFSRAAKDDEAARRRFAEEVLDFLRISHLRHERVVDLPYGLQKRVELGRALAARPRCLLLDEPVAGMNTEETEDMVRYILDCNQELGLTVLMVEHDMQLVWDISNRVVVLDFGKVIGAGTPEDVTRMDALRKAYLGSAPVVEA